MTIIRIPRAQCGPPAAPRPCVTHLHSSRILGGAKIVAERICVSITDYEHYECRFVEISPNNQIFESFWASFRFRIEKRILGWGFSETVSPSRYVPLIDAKSTDLVHLHSPYNSGMTISEIRRLGGSFPLVWTIHDARWVEARGRGSNDGIEIPFRAGLGFWFKQVGSIVLRARVRKAMGAAFVVFPSAWLRNSAITNGLVQPNRSAVISSPVSESFFNLPTTKSVAREKHGLPSDKPIVLFAAWKAWKTKGDMNKGYDLLEKAIVELRKHHDFVFVVLGNDGQGIPSTLEAYWIPPDGTELQVAEIMRAADCIIGASRQENLPATIQESLAVGTPAIVSRASGYLEVVEDRVDGLHFEQESHTDLAGKISEFLKSPDMRDAMSTNAIRRARERWHPSVSAEKYAQVYSQALSKGCP